MFTRVAIGYDMYILGAAAVTLNAQLLGGVISFFQVLIL
jgi:hypothetical protein